MKVLLTGIDGYIGSVLGGVLLECGHTVVGLDTSFYRIGQLYSHTGQQIEILRKDIRHVVIDDLQGYDAVIHLAELSNDPVGQINPQITYSINHEGTVALARLARIAGVERFIYFSSCSVYGFSEDNSLSTETSLTNPLTAYAKCKLLVERDLAALACDHFSPTFLRNATAYGVAPRMRFDLVVNNLAGLAWTTNQIRLESDGTPWRPLVHILDIAQATACTLAAPRDIIHNQIFNVGNNYSNHQVRDIAWIISEIFPGCQLLIGSNPSDRRDYRVNFDKIHTLLPGFKCLWNVELGAKQLLEVFQRIELSLETFEFRGFTRLKQIRYLLETGQVDSELFWKVPVLAT